jgi:hypothetical protein
MENFLIVALILLSFSCKKNNASEDITGYNWVLTAQVVSPAITIDGKTSTDYLSLQNPEGCTKNFGYTFNDTGIFTVSSTGALCDMVANSDQQKWEKDGDQLKLDFGRGMVRTLTVQKNSMIQTATITVDGANYMQTSTYSAQKK